MDECEEEELEEEKDEVEPEEAFDSSELARRRNASEFGLARPSGQEVERESPDWRSKGESRSPKQEEARLERGSLWPRE